MKHLLVLVFAALIAMPLVGCHADAEVDANNDRHMKKETKTTIRDDGTMRTRKVETETHVD